MLSGLGLVFTDSAAFFKNSNLLLFKLNYPVVNSILLFLKVPRLLLPSTDRRTERHNNALNQKVFDYGTFFLQSGNAATCGKFR